MHYSPSLVNLPGTQGMAFLAGRACGRGMEKKKTNREQGYSKQQKKQNFWLEKQPNSHSVSTILKRILVWIYHTSTPILSYWCSFTTTFWLIQKPTQQNRGGQRGSVRNQGIKLEQVMKLLRTHWCWPTISRKDTKEVRWGTRVFWKTN